jgi:hypothetical protein
VSHLPISFTGLGSGLFRYSCSETAHEYLGKIVFVVLFYACWGLPLPLLLIAWSRRDRRPTELSVLTLSAVLLNVAAIRVVKLTLLGADYSSRLYTTIAVNLIIAIILAITLGIKRRWIATAAALILAFAWLLVGAVNSVV